MVLVGVDIGATKTHIAAARSGEVRERLLPTSEWRVRHYNKDASVLADLISVTTAGEVPTVVVVGSHGCDSSAECAAFQAQFIGLIDAPVLVVNDAELLVPAAGHSQGIGVVAGTGSIAVSRLVDGTMAVAGGWGWLLGDEGGAVGLVREAVRAVRSALDGGDASDPLIECMMHALGTDNPMQFAPKLLQAGNAMLIGQHVSAVFAAADAGSILAGTVISEGGQALAMLAAQLVGRGAVGNWVVTGGGVITRQPSLMNAFREALASALPDWQVQLLANPPVHGALALATLIASGEAPFGLRAALPAHSALLLRDQTRA